MIIKNLAAMCRRTKHIVIFEDEPNDIQWIGTLRGIYPAYGVPRMETEQVKFLFDIPEEKRDECIAHNMGPIREVYDVSDGASDNEAVSMSLPMLFGGKMIFPLQTSAGVAFIDEDYLKPIENRAETKLYERYTEKGALYIVVKNGMMVEGVIIPEQIKAKALLERMEKITTLLAAQAAVEEEEET